MYNQSPFIKKPFFNNFLIEYFILYNNIIDLFLLRWYEIIFCGSTTSILNTDFVVIMADMYGHKATFTLFKIVFLSIL